MLKFGTIKNVAAFLNVSWDMVKDIHKSYLRDIQLMGVVRLSSIDHI